MDKLVIKQLEDLKVEAEYQLRHDPDNEVWIKDFNALEYAIDVITKDRSLEYFCKGATFSFILCILIYILYHL